MDRRRIILKSEGDDNAAGYGTFKKISATDHGSMPSVIRFGDGSYKGKNQTAYTSSDKTENIKFSIPGTIGDNDLEFHVEFDENLSKDDASGKYDDAVKMKTGIEDDSYAVYTRGDLLKKFIIYEVDDASYQAMSVMNYDFFPKVFATVDGKTKKIVGKAVCVLKSYTLKKAWVMVVSTIPDNIGSKIDTIILDSGIILTASEKGDEGKSTRFDNAVGLHANLCGAFSDPETYSPMNDLIQDSAMSAWTKHSSAATSYAIGKQAGYFRQMKQANTSSSNGKSQTYDVRTMKDGANNGQILALHTIKDNKNHIYVSGSDIAKYAGKRCYDIYKIDSDDGYAESRLMIDADTTESASYEVYAFIATYARYVFKYDGGITAGIVRKWLLGKSGSNITGQRFMCNYDLQDSELFTFSDGSSNFAEVLIPIYEDNSHRTDTEPTDDASGSISSEVEFSKDASYDFGISVGAAYASPADSRFDRILPYIYANEYARDYYGDKLPRVLSKDMNMFELRQFSAFDRVFDIIDDNVFSDKDDAAAGSTADQTTEAMSIDGDDICSKLKKAGYRDTTVNPDIFEKDTDTRNTLYENLAKMVFGDTDISKFESKINILTSVSANNDVSSYSIAIAKINSSEELTRTINDGKHTIIEKMPPYGTYDGFKYYILPLNVDGITSIKFDQIVHVVY
jgi:hypothetical protein